MTRPLTAQGASDDETDLWPQLRATHTRRDEVVAVYPHRDTVPQDIWLRVLGSAQYEIGILDQAGLSPIGDQPIVVTLAERTGSGVSVRICHCDPDAPGETSAHHWPGEQQCACSVCYRR